MLSAGVHPYVLHRRRNVLSRVKPQGAGLGASLILAMLFFVGLACGLRWIDQRFAPAPAPTEPRPVRQLSNPVSEQLSAGLRFIFGVPTVYAAAPAYASGAAQGDLTIEIPAGQTKNVTLKFKNVGSYVWRGSARNYVSLYAVSPYARKSAFWTSSWTSRTQPAKLSQALVRSGETGTLTFTLQAPAALGTYNERFQLAAENTAWVRGSEVRVTVNVVAPKTAASPVSAKAYVVMDAQTGEVIASQNPDDVRSIASLTKLMTIMTAHDAGLDPSAIVALSRDDEVGGGRLRVAVGTSLTVRDLVASTIIGSANNAANAVARATGASREEFIRRMDEKARALGMTHSSFADPSGIEVGNLSTAREVAMMAKAAFSDAWISEFDAVPVYDVMTSAGVHTIKNTNKLSGDGTFEVLAGKTGFINEAGYTFAARLKREGARELIVVVLGASSMNQSFNDAKTLAFKTWQGTQTALAK